MVEKGREVETALTRCKTCEDEEVREGGEGKVEGVEISTDQNCR